MKKIITASLVALATTTGFLLNNQPAQAHPRRYYHSRLYRHFPLYRQPLNYCYPTTNWLIDEDPAYHPQAYADGYRQGQQSAKKGNKYKPRTAGGEFSRGFDDGYYGRNFAGQKQIVPNEYKPYTTSQCSWY
ncbi:hypothetical protein [Mastigocladopsis repens]|uniref:hypothetical protein n=1 Tax=Mastigocladopsis repens TaxID=221287 RepID=UPI00030905B1|nr:hypothetical protein [Mastigocladopsis repens]